MTLRSLSGPGVAEQAFARERGRLALSLLVALCFGAAAPSVCHPQPGPPDENMPIAGGTTRLLRVAGIGVAVESARALLVLARTVHGSEEPGHSAESPRFAAYLATVSRLTAGLSDPNAVRARDALIEACGLVSSERALRPGQDHARRQRRQLMRDAGFPVDDWTGALTRGATISAHVDVDHVPALLPRGLWETAVFEKAVSAEDLAGAILDDRGAALLYLGLHSLDPDTLSFLARSPSLVATIHRRHAGPFAAFAESIIVRQGRVVVPGGTRAEPLWEALVGVPLSSPERFIAELLRREEGRLAWLFDAVRHTDADRQAFVLGLRLETAAARLAHARRLYSTFAQFQRRQWSVPARPFTRSPADPGFVLQQVAATSDGRMAPPRSRRLWEAVLGEASANTPAREDDEVDAAWLLAQLARGSTATRRARLNSVLFAQRLWGDAGSQPVRAASDPEALGACLTAYPAHEMLLITLERIGLAEPLDCVRAVRLAGSLTTTADSRGASMRLAILQAALALLARAADRGALDARTAQSLARDLFALPPDAEAYPDAMARWLETGLIAALPPPERPPRTSAIEHRLLDGLAGVFPRGTAPIVEWEDHRYRVDPAAADRLRLERIRAKQGGLSLDAALEAARSLRVIADPRSSRDDIEAALAGALSAGALSASAPPSGQLFGYPVADLLDPQSAGARETKEGVGPTSRADRAARRGNLLAVLLADVLTSLAYAVAIGDPDSAVVLAENPAHAHDFAVGSTLEQAGPWDSPISVRIGSVSAVRGSLLGLVSGLGMTWLRPTTQALPPRVPTLDPGDARGLGESVAALNPFRLTDDARDRIAAMLQRGRQRLAELSREPAALDRVLESAGVEQWRRRLALHMALDGVEAVGAYLSLGEVLALGGGADRSPDFEVWGLAQRAIDGSPQLSLPTRLRWHQLSGRAGSGLLPACVPDLHLRVVEHLAAARLPAALAPGVLAYAAWDVARTAAMTGPDDWLAMIRAAQALTPERVEDYVAALTLDGPMVPVAQTGADGK